MTNYYDEKGKIFTNVVAKQPVAVTIQTNQNLILGEIYVRPGMRVKDELNGQERFVAVTKAVIYDSQGQERYRTNFLVLNTDQIVWIIPEEEIRR